MELQLYRAQFAVGKSSWQLEQELWDAEDFVEAEGDVPPPPQVEHMPVIIPKPTTKQQVSTAILNKQHVVAYFDGGAA